MAVAIYASSAGGRLPSSVYGLDEVSEWGPQALPSHSVINAHGLDSSNVSTFNNKVIELTEKLGIYRWRWLFWTPSRRTWIRLPV